MNNVMKKISELTKDHLFNLTYINHTSNLPPPAPLSVLNALALFSTEMTQISKEQ